jgi:hypothetical protein
MTNCWPLRETRKKICNGTATTLLVLYGLLTIAWLIGGIALLCVYEQVKYDCGWKQPSAQCTTLHNTTIVCVTHNLKRDTTAPFSCPRLDIVYDIYWLFSKVFGILVVGTIVALVPCSLIGLCMYTFCKKLAIDYCDC